MRKFFIFLIVAITTTSIAMAQDAKDAKLKGLKPEAGSFEAFEKESNFVADPVVLNGQTYMSAFIRLDSPSAIGKL